MRILKISSVIQEGFSFRADNLPTYLYTVS